MISPMQEINELPSIPEDLEIEFSEIKELKVSLRSSVLASSLLVVR